MTGAARGIGRATAELFLVPRLAGRHVRRRRRRGGRRRRRPAPRRARRPRRPRRRTVADRAAGASAAAAGWTCWSTTPACSPPARSPAWTRHEHRRMVDVNVTGVVNGASRGYPYLERSGRGRAAQPVLGVRALRAADAGDLRRDEGGGQVPHRGARHRVAGVRGGIGSQPAAAVRRHRDGLARRRRARPASDASASGSPPRTSLPRPGRSCTSGGVRSVGRTGRSGGRPG